jgi:hypothetical protein
VRSSLELAPADRPHRRALRPALPPHEQLAALVGAATAVDLDDVEAFAPLRGRAQQLTSALAACGQLPGHLVVAPHDPPVVVVRTLTAARRAYLRGADGHPRERSGSARST